MCWEGSLGPCFVGTWGLTVNATSLTPETFDWPTFWSVLRCMPESESAEQKAEDDMYASFNMTIMIERSSDGKQGGQISKGTQLEGLLRRTT